jgi:DNA repair protein RadC
MTNTPSKAKPKRQRVEDQLVQEAIIALEKRLFKRGPCLESPQTVREYLRLKLARETREVFSALFLDSRHRVIAYEPLFFGTIDSATIHPRQVVRQALKHNCAAIIAAHNHPSGDTTPSEGDKAITTRLKMILDQIEVRFLDHFIIGKGEPFSFAEAGLIRSSVS